MFCVQVKGTRKKKPTGGNWIFPMLEEGFFFFNLQTATRLAQWCDDWWEPRPESRASSRLSTATGLRSYSSNNALHFWRKTNAACTADWSSHWIKSNLIVFSKSPEVTNLKRQKCKMFKQFFVDPHKRRFFVLWPRYLFITFFFYTDSCCNLVSLPHHCIKIAILMVCMEDFLIRSSCFF